MELPNTYAIWSNPGTLDMRALTIMALNAKTADNPIGYFGTGFKYAMAVLARFGCTVLIEPGDGTVWELDRKATDFRGKPFTQLLLTQIYTKEKKSIELPYTTELGKNWEMWQAIREVESNMRDEGGDFDLGQLRKPEVGKVRVCVTSGGLPEQVMDLRKQTFFDLQMGTVHKEMLGEYREQTSRHVYFRNIKVLTIDKPFLYTYNKMTSTTLTEDRTLANTYQLASFLAYMFAEGTELYRQRLMENIEAAEWQYVDFGYVNRWPDAARKQMKDFYLAGGKLPDKLKKIVIEYMIDQESKEEYKGTTGNMKMLQEAKDILMINGRDVEKYKISIRKALPGGVLGQADFAEDTILISKDNFENGLECLISTLFEEFAHLETRMFDETREFQDYLVRQNMLSMRRIARLLTGKEDDDRVAG